MVGVLLACIAVLLFAPVATNVPHLASSAHNTETLRNETAHTNVTAANGIVSYDAMRASSVLQARTEMKMAWPHATTRYANALQSCITPMLSTVRSAYHGAIVWPVYRLYRNGPSWYGHGFWRGAPAHEVCASLTHVDADFWRLHPVQCERRMLAEVHSCVILFETMAYFALLFVFVRCAWTHIVRAFLHAPTWVYVQITHFTAPRHYTSWHMPLLTPVGTRHPRTTLHGSTCDSQRGTDTQPLAVAGNTRASMTSCVETTASS